MENVLTTLKQIGFLSLGMFAGGIGGSIVGTLLSFGVWGIAYLGAYASSSDVVEEPLPYLVVLVMTLIGGVLIGSVAGIVFAFKKSVR